MIKHLKKSDGSQMDYLADLIIRRVDTVPYTALAQSARRQQQKNPLAYLKAWVMCRNVDAEVKSDLEYYRLIFASDTENIQGKIYLEKQHSEDEDALNDFGDGDVISIILDEEDEENYAMVYNHDTNVLTHCFDPKRLDFVAAKGFFPLINSTHAIEKMAAFFPAAHKKGRFARRGALPRPHRPHNDGPIYCDYEGYTKFKDVVGAFTLRLGIVFRVLILAFIVGFFAFMIGLVVHALTS